MTHDTQTDTAQNWFAQGNAHALRGEFDQALVCFDRVRGAFPHDPAPYNNLASTLVRLGRFPEALQRYSEASVLAPDNAEVHHNLGWVFEQMRRLEEAVAAYQAAVRLNPALDGSYNNLANCLQALGHFDEADVAYRRAIDLAPDTALYYRNFVQSKRLSVDDPYFSSLEALARRADSLRPDNQAQVHFALGHVLAEGGQHDRAFTHILRANALHRRYVRYDEALALKLFRELPEYLTADVFKAKANLGDSADSPIFVIGMPRSGSTLIEQILASHPDVFGAGERPEFGRALVEALSPSGDPSNGLTVDAMHSARGDQLRALGADYLRLIQEVMPESQGARRVVDKYPFNFINLGIIHLALPNARFIHSRRAPVETCLSIFSRVFQDVPFSYDLGELGRYYRAYDELMSHWRGALPNGVMLEVQYEDLVDDLEGTARRMLTHCGLDWDARCLTFHQTERQVTTASASQVRRPIYRTSLQRWRPAADAIQPLFDGLGPDLSGAADEGRREQV